MIQTVPIRTGWRIGIWEPRLGLRDADCFDQMEVEHQVGLQADLYSIAADGGSLRA